MPRLPIFYVATAATVLVGGAATGFALAGDLTTALALVGVAIILVAVLHYLADRRSTRADRRMLDDLRKSFGSLDDDVSTLRKHLATELSTLSEASTTLRDSVTEASDRSRRLSEGTERRLIASIDAARLEAAARTEPTRTT